MSHTVSTTPDESQEPVAINDWSSVELPQEIVVAIADYLDVFIEIDLYQKQLKKGEEDD
jgi:hypothetical protein